MANPPRMVAGQKVVLRLRAVDAQDNPLADAHVFWRLGNLEKPAARTDEQGRARWEPVVNSAGTLSAHAVVKHLGVEQELTVVLEVSPGPVHFLEVTLPEGTPAEGRPVALQVKAMDAQENVVAGQEVSWEGLAEGDVLVAETPATNTEGLLQASLKLVGPGERRLVATARPRGGGNLIRSAERLLSLVAPEPAPPAVDAGSDAGSALPDIGDGGVDEAGEADAGLSAPRSETND